MNDILSSVCDAVAEGRQPSREKCDEYSYAAKVNQFQHGTRCELQFPLKLMTPKDEYRNLKPLFISGEGSLTQGRPLLVYRAQSLCYMELSSPFLVLYCTCGGRFFCDSPRAKKGHLREWQVTLRSEMGPQAPNFLGK